MNKTKVGEYLTLKWLVVGVRWMCACLAASVGSTKENIDFFFFKRGWMTCLYVCNHMGWDSCQNHHDDVMRFMSKPIWRCDEIHVKTTMMMWWDSCQNHYDDVMRFMSKPPWRCESLSWQIGVQLSSSLYKTRLWGFGIETWGQP
jgi:hypothetical protein